MFTKTGLFICDLQQKVIPTIKNSQNIINSVNTLIGCNHEYRKNNKDPKNTYGSVVVAQFMSHKLGLTDKSIIDSLQLNNNNSMINNNKMYYEKTNYTMFDDKIDQYLKYRGINHVVLTGVQTEWCITQSAIDFLKNGYEVDVIKDAVGSFSTDEHLDALERLKKRSINVITTHSWIVERLRVANSPVTKWYLNVLKNR